MARPKSPHPRDRQLSLSLTAKEAAELARRAENAGKRPAIFAREALLAAGAEQGPSVLPAKFDRLVYEQVKRIGVNLNQIARQLNGLGRVSMVELDQALREVRDFLRRIA